MSTPGIGDSYFYEWYVGLENVIKMLNPDSGIRCVIFRHDEYDTIDDVVVEYTNGSVQMCYQVKHNIETAAPKSLTFGRYILKDSIILVLWDRIILNHIDSQKLYYF